MDGWCKCPLYGWSVADVRVVVCVVRTAGADSSGVSCMVATFNIDVVEVPFVVGAVNSTEALGVSSVVKTVINDNLDALCVDRRLGML